MVKRQQMVYNKNNKVEIDMKYNPVTIRKIKKVCDRIQLEMDLSGSKKITLSYVKIRENPYIEDLDPNAELRNFERTLKILVKEKAIIVEEWPEKEELIQPFIEKNYSIRILSGFNKIVGLSTATSYSKKFWFDHNKVFWLKTNTGDLKSIDFSPKRGDGLNTYYLMSALVWVLEKDGTENMPWFETKISRLDITRFIEREFKKSIDKNWIGDTVHNLRQKFSQNWEGYIELSFMRELGLYLFKIKGPN